MSHLENIKPGPEFNDAVLRPRMVAGVFKDGAQAKGWPKGYLPKGPSYPFDD
jgi:hypothetical protein